MVTITTEETSCKHLSQKMKQLTSIRIKCPSNWKRWNEHIGLINSLMKLQAWRKRLCCVCFVSIGCHACLNAFVKHFCRCERWYGGLISKSCQLKHQKSLGFSNQKMSSLDKSLFVSLYSITILRFYIMKALLALVFTLFSCQIISVAAFVNEILQMCVK